MARPDHSYGDLETLLAHMRRRLDLIERRQTFLGPRRATATAGGLPAIPVPTVAPDVSGYYTLTTSYVATTQFVGAAYGSLWVLMATDGSTPTDFTAQLIYPHDTSRVMATSSYVETHATLGPIHRAAFTEDSVLGAATGAYNTSISLQAKTVSTSTTTKFRIIAAGWGTANV